MGVASFRRVRGPWGHARDCCDGFEGEDPKAAEVGRSSEDQGRAEVEEQSLRNRVRAAAAAEGMLRRLDQLREGLNKEICTMLSSAIVWRSCNRERHSLGGSTCGSYADSDPHRKAGGFREAGTTSWIDVNLQNAKVGK